MKLKDKVALVTGGGSGIGQSCAIHFADEGAKVVIWDVNMEGAAETEKTIKAKGGTVMVADVDVTDWGKTHAGVENIVKEFGTVDILCACVGGGKFLPFPTITPEAWDWEVKFNLTSAMNCTHAVTGPMMKQNYGKIILFTTGPGYTGHPNLSGYAAAKAAVCSLAESLTSELGPSQIRVNVIGPGLTDTPLTRNAFAAFGEVGDQLYKDLIAKQPFGRSGIPSDIAKVAVFLASPESDWISGQTIEVNGGALAH